MTLSRQNEPATLLLMWPAQTIWQCLLCVFLRDLCGEFLRLTTKTQRTQRNHKESQTATLPTVSSLNEGVVAQATIKDVQARTADEDVVAIAAEQRIRAVATDEHVVTFAAVGD